MPRRTHKKSRNGCFECKRRHMKCDEARPSCSNCLTVNRTCEYKTTLAPHPPPPLVPTTPSTIATSTTRSTSSTPALPFSTPAPTLQPSIASYDFSGFALSPIPYQSSPSASPSPLHASVPAVEPTGAYIPQRGHGSHHSPNPHHNSRHPHSHSHGHVHLYSQQHQYGQQGYGQNAIPSPPVPVAHQTYQPDGWGFAAGAGGGVGGVGVDMNGGLSIIHLELLYELASEEFVQWGTGPEGLASTRDIVMTTAFKAPFLLWEMLAFSAERLAVLRGREEQRERDGWDEDDGYGSDADRVEERVRDFNDLELVDVHEEENYERVAAGLRFNGRDQRCEDDEVAEDDRYKRTAQQKRQGTRRRRTGGREDGRDKKFYHHLAVTLQTRALATLNAIDPQTLDTDQNRTALFLFAGIIGFHKLSETLNNRYHPRHGRRRRRYGRTRGQGSGPPRDGDDGDAVMEGVQPTISNTTNTSTTVTNNNSINSGNGSEDGDNDQEENDEEFSHLLFRFLTYLRLHLGVRAVASGAWLRLVQSPLKPLLDSGGKLAVAVGTGPECEPLKRLILYVTAAADDDGLDMDAEGEDDSSEQSEELGGRMEIDASLLSAPPEQDPQPPPSLQKLPPLTREESNALIRALELIQFALDNFRPLLSESDPHAHDPSTTDTTHTAGNSSPKGVPTTSRRLPTRTSSKSHPLLSSPADTAATTPTTTTSRSRPQTRTSPPRMDAKTTTGATAIIPSPSPTPESLDSQARKSDTCHPGQTAATDQPRTSQHQSHKSRPAGTAHDHDTTHNPARDPTRRFPPPRPIPEHARWMTLNWLLLVPPPFAVLLERRRPEALLVLVYYGVLMHMCREEVWVVGSAGRYWVRVIGGYLGEEWSEWVGWGKGIVGLGV